MKLYVVLQVMTMCLILTPVAAGDQTTEESGIDRLLDAIERVESNRDSRAVGDGGRALGAYQIHKPYWKDGTKFLGVDWSYDQARNPAKAREVVRAYLLHYGRGRNLLQKARIHNGGPRGHRKKATLKYARKIAEVLKRSEEEL